jgi:hypothetical protein
MPEDQRAEAEERAGELGGMPPWRFMLMGITGGFIFRSAFGPDPLVPRVTRSRHGPTPLVAVEDRAVVARLVAEAGDDAATIAQLVERRWNALPSWQDDLPLTEFMAVTSTGTVDAVATIDFQPVGGPQIWWVMVFENTLLPFAFESTLGDDGDPTPAG